MDTIFRIALKELNQNLQCLKHQPTYLLQMPQQLITSKMTAPEIYLAAIYLLICNFDM